MTLTQLQPGSDTMIMMQHSADIVVFRDGAPSIASAYRNTTVRNDQARKVAYRVRHSDDKLLLLCVSPAG